MVTKIIYYVTRMVDSPRGGRTRYEKRYGHIYQVQNYQPQKNREVELRSHLQKLLNGLHRLNLLELEWIIFDQINGWVT